MVITGRMIIVETEVSEMRKMALLLGCLCLVTAAIASSKEAADLQPPDWLSSGIGRITYYGPFGYPTAVIPEDRWYPASRYYWDGAAFSYPLAVRFYDDRLYHDEWYPVARAFLDGPLYPAYYRPPFQPTHIDGSWWRDPRGYRPLYRIGPGYVIGAPYSLS